MAAKRVRKRTGKSPKKYRFQLSLSGIGGIALVGFCLFLWMFLLGIWAGQTILLPSATNSILVKKSNDAGPAHSDSLQTVLPAGKKKRISH